MTQVSESLIYTSRNVRNTRVLSREIEIYGAAEVHYMREDALNGRSWCRWTHGLMLPAGELSRYLMLS